MGYIERFFKHLNKVLTHKYWVGVYCFKMGLYWQGITHDLSKFSPVEFFESVKYYNGKRSPIDVCKDKNGYSEAWMHHKGRNKHHFEYWNDVNQIGDITIRMPKKYALELICDYVGAARAYKGEGFSFQGEYDWWQEKKKHIRIHEDTCAFIDLCMDYMKRKEEFVPRILADYYFAISQI